MFWLMVLAVVQSTVLFFLQLLPAGDPDVVSAINGGVDGFQELINAANFIIDVNTVFNFVAIVFTIEAAYYAMRLALWLLSQLPFGVKK